MGFGRQNTGKTDAKLVIILEMAKNQADYTSFFAKSLVVWIF